MTPHTTFEYPNSGDITSIPAGLTIIDFINGVLKTPDGVKHDLPYALSDTPHSVMNFLNLNVSEDVKIEVDETGEFYVYDTFKYESPFKYMYITATNPTVISFIVSTDPDMSVDITKKTTQNITAVEYNANDDPLYIGKSFPSTLKSSPFWQIQKIIYDASQNPTDILFADGVQSFTKTWNDRSIYDYS